MAPEASCGLGSVRMLALLSLNCLLKETGGRAGGGVVVSRKICAATR